MNTHVTITLTPDEVNTLLTIAQKRCPGKQPENALRYFIEEVVAQEVRTIKRSQFERARGVGIT